MTIEQGLVDQFGVDLFSAVHDFTLDTFKVALYQPSANLTLALTTGYTASGESTGTGYTAGGQEISVASGFPKLIKVGTTRKLQVDFDDVTFASVTLTTRAALIYNDSAAGKPAVAIIDFGATLQPSAQPVRVRMPDPVSVVAAVEMQMP